MHDLHNDAPARVMHSVCHPAPASDLRVGLDAGSADIALAGRRGKDPFGDDHACTCTLRVIGRGQIADDASVVGARARHRGHYEAIGEINAAKPHGGEEWVHSLLHCVVERI